MVLSVLRRLSAELLDRADYLFTSARLRVLDWLAPMPETPTDIVGVTGSIPSRAHHFVQGDRET
jgi:hypothetical protein